MVKLNKIYTRTGDDGSTGLVDGTRIGKDSLRVGTYGDIDETNSIIGLARLHVHDQALAHALNLIQNDLFDLGADLATPSTDTPNPKPALRMVAAQTLRLETDIDRLNQALHPLNSFVLPGGSQAAAYLHLARSVSRRAERQLIALSKTTTINPQAITYLNRLSDFLFVAARWCNDKGATDIQWVPGATRELLMK